MDSSPPQLAPALPPTFPQLRPEHHMIHTRRLRNSVECSSPLSGLCSIFAQDRLYAARPHTSTRRRNLLRRSKLTGRVWLIGLRTYCPKPSPVFEKRGLSSPSTELPARADKTDNMTPEELLANIVGHVGSQLVLVELRQIWYEAVRDGPYAWLQTTYMSQYIQITGDSTGRALFHSPVRFCATRSTGRDASKLSSSVTTDLNLAFSTVRKQKSAFPMETVGMPVLTSPWRINVCTPNCLVAIRTTFPIQATNITTTITVLAVAC